MRRLLILVVAGAVCALSQAPFRGEVVYDDGEVMQCTHLSWGESAYVPYILSASDVGKIDQSRWPHLDFETVRSIEFVKASEGEQEELTCRLDYCFYRKANVTLRDGTKLAGVVLSANAMTAYRDDGPKIDLRNLKVISVRRVGPTP